MSDIKRILVMLPNPMGDAVLATSALCRLRRAFPDAHITGCGHAAATAILWDHPALNGLDCLDDSAGKGAGVCVMAGFLKKQRFDAALIFPNSVRTALMVRLAGIPRRIGYDRDGRGVFLTDRARPFQLRRGYAPLSMLDYYGWLTDRAIEALGGRLDAPYYDDDLSLNLATSEQDRQGIADTFAKWQLPPDAAYAVLVPGGAFGGSKFWPVERYARLGEKLHRDGRKIILLCAPNETEQQIEQAFQREVTVPFFSTAAKAMSLGTVKELIRRATVVVANDTGPCHIAAAFGVPLVTLFGPTDPRWTATGYEKEIRLRVDVDCGPCQKPVCATDHRCLERIGVEEVYQAAGRLLSGSAGSGVRTSLVGTAYRPFAESFAPLADGRGLVHQDFRRLLEKNGLRKLEDYLSFSAGEMLHKPGLGKRRRIRFELQSDSSEPVALFLKCFDAGSLWSRLKRWLKNGVRACEGLLEFDAALALGRQGIPVARPLAWGGDDAAAGGRRSFFLAEGLPEADALERLLPQWEENARCCGLLRDRCKLIQEVAGVVRRLHACGFVHRDLYLAHIFLCRERGGREFVSLIDLQRVFKPCCRMRRWVVKDLAQLLYSAQAYFSRMEILRFFRLYRNTDRLRPTDKMLARDILTKCGRIARHDRRRQQRLSKGAGA